jgi:hypothetical protein
LLAVYQIPGANALALDKLGGLCTIAVSRR